MDRETGGRQLDTAQLFVFKASCIETANSLTTRIKRYGNRGQPCRRPQEPLKPPKGCPLMLTEKVAVDMHS